MEERAAFVTTVKDEGDEGGGDADRNGDEERGHEVPDIRLWVQFRDVEAIVRFGVVTEHAGVRGGGDIVPGVTHHSGGVATRAGVDLEYRHPREGGGGPGELG